MKVKILHVGRIVGGVETSVYEICRAINPEQFECTVVTNASDTIYLNQSEEELKKYTINFERAIHPIKDLMALIQLIRIVRAERPNIIHCHSSKGGLIGRVASLFFRTKVFYTPQAFSFLSTVSGFQRSFIIWYERLLRPMTDVLLACSASEANRAVNEVKFDKEKVLVWANSITKVNVSEQPLDPALLINLGRPSYQKNTKLLIAIMDELVNKRSVNIRLRIIGVGVHSPLKDEVVELIKELKLEDHIELVKWVDRRETLEILSSALCYVSTSRYEGLPYAILEAMALGIPVVATDADGNRDCVLDQKTGYLIKNEAVREFADGIASLYSNPLQRDKMSNESLRYFEEQFNINTSINRLEAIYMS